MATTGISEHELHELGKLYVTDMSISLTSLAEELTHKHGRRINRKVLSSELRSLGYARTRAQVAESKGVIGRLKKSVLEDADMEAARKAIVTSYGSLESFVARVESGELSLEAVGRESGANSYFARKVLVEAGGSPPPAATADTYVHALERLASQGWTKAAITSAFNAPEFSRGDLLAKFRQFEPTMSEKRFGKILDHLGLRMTEEQIKRAQGRRSRTMLEDGLAAVTDAGYTPESLAKLYDSDFAVRFADLFELVISKTSLPITERQIVRYVSPLTTSTTRSREEHNFARWLESATEHKIIRNDRKVLSGKELDFIIPALKLAIEFNGDYWHSDEFMFANHGCSSTSYHAAKADAAKKSDLTLVHVWESDWQKHRERTTAELARVFAGDKPSTNLLRLQGPVMKRLKPHVTPGEIQVGKFFAEGSCGRSTVAFVGSEDNPYLRARAATKAGLRLKQIYPWDSTEVIDHLLGFERATIKRKLSARKLEVREVAKKPEREFLDANHVQGFVRGSKWAKGLFDGDELLAVATFGPSRFRKGYEYEFLRYAVKRGVIIRGGAPRLMKRFVSDVNPKSVLSYVDYAHTTGDTFLPSCGFIELKPSGGTVMWVHKDGRYFTQSSIQRLGADRLLGTSYGPREVCGLNNEGIMKAEGFAAYRTAGNRVFEWRATT